MRSNHTGLKYLQISCYGLPTRSTYFFRE